MWKRLKMRICRQIFAADEGALLKIWVLGTSQNDWQLVLNYFSVNYLAVYSEDGDNTPMPSAEAIFETRQDVSKTLEVMLSGFTVNCHFFEAGRIEMNILPEDVDTPEKIEAFFNLTTSIAALLNKEVYVAPEFGGLDPERLPELAICVLDPNDQSIRSRLE